MTIEEKKEYQKEYRLKNKSRKKELDRIYKENNKEKLYLYNKEYYKNNKVKLNAYANNYCIQKNKLNVNFRLTKILRSRIYYAIKSIDWKGNCNREELLGGDINIVKAHIESLFKEGMNWENQGKWYIDHILPIGICDNQNDIIARCHYKNLQPLWAINNLKKGSSIIVET
jgi:hypothetical protein